MEKRFFWMLMSSISVLNGFLFYLASNSVLKHGIDGVDNQGALLVIPFLWMTAMVVLPLLNICTFVYGRKIDRNSRIHITDIFHLRRLCKKELAGRLFFFGLLLVLMFIGYDMFQGIWSVAYALSGGFLMLCLYSWKLSGKMIREERDS